MVLRATCWKSTTALVVISPAMTTSPVLHSVSAATRENLSCARMASSTASEIWSAPLSGWPADTDSDVNKNELLIFSTSYLIRVLTSRAQRLTERFAIQIREFRQGKFVVLGALHGDLDRAHQRGDASGRLPVEAAQYTVDESGPIRVASPGGIEHLARRRAGNVVHLAVGVDHRVFRAARDDQRLHVLHAIGGAPAGAFLQQRPLVVVEREPVGDRDEAAEVFTLEQRHGLARVEDERNVRRLELLRVLQHALAAVRRDRADGYAVVGGDLDAVRMIHRAWVERGDLVRVEIGGDEGLGAVLFRN